MKEAKKLLPHIITLLFIFLSAPYFFKCEKIIYGFPMWGIYSLIISLLLSIYLSFAVIIFWDFLSDEKDDKSI